MQIYGIIIICILEDPKICIPLETEPDLCYNKGRKRTPEAARGKAEKWTARRDIFGVFSNKPSKNALETPTEFDYRGNVENKGGSNTSAVKNGKKPCKRWVFIIMQGQLYSLKNR